MNDIKFKKIIVPIIYGGVVTAFLVGMYFVQDYSRKVLFSKKNNLEYVDGEIVEEKDKDIPVVSTPSIIIRPYLDENVKLLRSFYDYTKENNEQEKSIIYYENTYMQNSGVDYVSDNSFDVVSILDGTVISVDQNDILGTTVQIRHSNDLISVYQSVNDVCVKKDDAIIQGQIIAKSGLSNINKDSKNNLHFELYYKGKIVNPEEYYNKSLDEL